VVEEEPVPTSRTAGTVKGTDADPTSEFFDGLARRGHEPLLENVSGTLRFDLTDGKHVHHWYVVVTKGDVAVSRKRAAADAVLRVDKMVFEGMTAGTVNAMAAVLRGAVVPEGSLHLVVMFQRLFPGPPTGFRSSVAADRRRKGLR
jgi:hypothetical protein